MHFDSKNNNIKIIGIAGGSGSGKTTLTKQLIKLFKQDDILMIEMDSYYKDLINLPFKEREQKNFDHPDAFDFNLLENQLNKIINKEPISIPIYDYSKHIRKKESRLSLIPNFIFIEGILIFYKKKIRNLIDLKIFIDTNEKIRYKRRLKRDLLNRKRTKESIINQYQKYVQPMYEKYIHPTKKCANFIISGNNKNDQIIDDIYNKIINLKP